MSVFKTIWSSAIDCKYRFNTSAESLIGNREEFSLDHRIFNSISIIVAASYVFRILINMVLGIYLFQLTLYHIVTLFSILFVYCISRFLKKIESAKIIFFVLLLVSNSFNWMSTAGTKGNILFYYVWLFAIISYIFPKKARTIIFSIILLNITILFFIEYYYPSVMTQQIGDQKLSIYRYLHVLLISLLTVLIIQTVKILSKIDSSLRDIPIAKNDFQTENPEKNAEIFSKLTLQERKVLDFILIGKRNKEIAGILFIDVSTVKTHINNIYRKVGIHKRSRIVSKVNKGNKVNILN